MLQSLNKYQFRREKEIIHESVEKSTQKDCTFRYMCPSALLPILKFSPAYFHKLCNYHEISDNEKKSTCLVAALSTFVKRNAIHLQGGVGDGLCYRSAKPSPPLSSPSPGSTATKAKVHEPPRFSRVEYRRRLPCN